MNEEIKNKTEETFNLENLSEVYRKIGNYPEALEYGQKGLNLALEIDFPQRIGRILKDLGVTHFELGEYQTAYEYFKKAKEVAQRIEDKELEVLVLIALSKFLAVLNDEKSLNRLLEEVTGVINTINDERSLISSCQIRSMLARKKGQFEEALKLLDKAYVLSKRLNLGEEVFSLTLGYAEIYLDHEEIEKSREFLDQAKNSGQAQYVLLQPTFYLISGRIEWKSGNFKAAQKDFENALGLAEKTRNMEMTWRIHHHLGKLFLSSHNVEKAYPEFENACGILRTLSNNIENEELKSNYLKDQKKQELLSDLRQAAKELIGEIKMA
ncbi:MAG: tetratricopeptide repeat protein [Candidatus Zixiibacteriota bacterium]